MDADTLRQLRGGVELADHAFEAAVGAIAEAQQSIARQIYAPFELFGPLAGPARLTEQIQTAITSQIYLVILGASRMLARSAVAILERQAGPTD